MNNLVNSPDFVEKKLFFDKNFQIYMNQSQKSQCRDEKTKLHVVIKNLNIDYQERLHAEKERSSFLDICFM